MDLSLQPHHPISSYIIIIVIVINVIGGASIALILGKMDHNEWGGLTYSTVP